MGETTWHEKDIVGWLDHDQSGVLKLTAVIKFAWASYRQFTVQLAGLPRSEYFSTHGCVPVISYIEVSSGAATQLDTEISMEVNARVGFVPGPRPRYGGITLTTLRDADGVELGRLRNHWVWFNTATSSVQREPVVAFVDQDDELGGPPARPLLSGEAGGPEFRWALRDTDLNNHANTAAYIERAENAIADGRLDAEPHRRVNVWFRRPSFFGEAMHAAVTADAGEAAVEIRSADEDVRCTLQFTS